MGDLIATCDLCGKRLTASDAVAHFRDRHPGTQWELETWPDGEPVVIDSTLSPEEFEAE